MRTEIQTSAKAMTNKRKWHNRWMKLVGTLAAVTVFCTTYALILPAITMSTTTYCGHEEHTHTDECGARQLICVLEEGKAKTELEEVITTEEVLVDAGHTHTDDCYEVETVLTCDIEEVEATEESEGHTHDDSCYEEVTTLVCEEEEREAVYETKETVTYKEVEVEEGHVHTDACYKASDCDIEEHVHEDICYSNKEADVETASDWEKTLPREKELKDDWKEDTLIIAQSQIGYKESEDNFDVVDGERKGYTRYGQKYGAPYSDWCAMFIQFCMDYAGVDSKVFPSSASVPTWAKNADKNDNFFSPEDHEVNASDIIFFDWDNNDSPDHVGIVEEVKKNDDDEVVEIVTIEGNSENKVRRNTYKADDKDIYGYAVIPEKEEETLEAPVIPSTGNDYEVVLGSNQRAVATAYTDDTYTAVAINEETDIVITGDLPVVRYTDEAGKVVEESAVEVKIYEVDAPQINNTDAVLAYDITIFYKEGYAPEGSDGIFQPVTPVQVSFESKAIMMASAEAYSVYHIKEDGTVEYVGGDNSMVEDGVVAFDAEHFSPYLVHVSAPGYFADTFGAYPEGSGGNGGSNANNDYATIEDGNYVVTSWKALENLIESRQYKDSTGTVKSDAPNELSIVVAADLGANTQIKIASNQTITLTGIQQDGGRYSTIYVDSAEGVSFNEMFWVNGGTLNTNNLVLSGKKASYTPGANTNCDLTHSKATVDDSKLFIGGKRLHKVGGDIETKDSGDYPLSIVSSSGQTVTSLTAGNVYYVVSLNSVPNAWLKLNDSGNGYDFRSYSDAGTSDKVKWKYNSDGVLENVSNSNYIIYRDASGSVSVRNKTSIQGCDSASNTSVGKWTPQNSSTVDSVVTDGTKGLFIAADNNATVNLNGGSSIQDMTYTGDKSMITPVYLKGATMNINGGIIKNNKVTIPKNGNKDATYANEKDTDINWNGATRRAKYDGATISAGGVIIDNGGTLKLDNGSIEGNTGIAGAVYIIKGKFEQNGGDVKDNHSFKGAVVVDGSTSTYDFNNGKVKDNDAVHLGGGITVINEGKLNVGKKGESARPEITGNKTLHQGGGIYVHSNNVKLNKALINNNTAHLMGGGIYVYGGDANSADANSVLVLDNAYVTGNKAGNEYFTDLPTGFNDLFTSGYNYGEGGGIWLCSHGSTIMDGTKIRMWDNYAHGRGEDFQKAHNGKGLIMQFYTDADDKYVNTTNNESATFETSPFGPYPKGSDTFQPIQRGPFALRNDKDYTINTDAVVISNNRAGYAGGGIGVNGILSYTPPGEQVVYVPKFSFTKNWLQHNENPDTVTAGKSAEFVVRVYDIQTGSPKLVAEYGGGDEDNQRIILSDNANNSNEYGTSGGFTTDKWTAIITLPQINGENGESIYKNLVTYPTQQNQTLSNQTFGDGKVNKDETNDTFSIDNKIRIQIEEIDVTTGTALNVYELKLGDLTYTTTMNQLLNTQQDIKITYNRVTINTSLSNKNINAQGRVRLTKKDKERDTVLTDPDNQPEFRISRVNANNELENEAGTVINGSKGVYTTEYLTPGKYAIWESVAPTGYDGIGDDKLIYVNIANDGTPSFVSTTAANGYVVAGSVIEIGAGSTSNMNDGGTLPINVYNEKNTQFTLVKVDENGDPLPSENTEFIISTFDEVTFSKRFKIDSTGASNTYKIASSEVTTFFKKNGMNLQLSNFYLKETAAPSNQYNMLKTVVPFRVRKINGNTYQFIAMTRKEVLDTTRFEPDPSDSKILVSKADANVKIFFKSTADSEKEIEGVNINENEGSLTYTVENEKKPYPVYIKKVDQTGATTLTGATFYVKALPGNPDRVNGNTNVYLNEVTGKPGIYKYDETIKADNTNKPFLKVNTVYALWEETAPTVGGDEYIKLNEGRGIDIPFILDEEGTPHLIKPDDPDGYDYSKLPANPGLSYTASPKPTLEQWKEAWEGILARNQVSIETETVNGKSVFVIKIVNTKPMDSQSPAYLILKAKKDLIVNGEEGSLADEFKGVFQFKIEAITDGAPMPVNEIAENGGEKGDEINFGFITFNKKGTYQYKISEILPPEEDRIPGVMYSDVEKTITVEVRERKILGTNAKEYYVYSVTSSDGDGTVVVSDSTTSFTDIELLGDNVKAQVDSYSIKYMVYDPQTPGATMQYSREMWTYKTVNNNVAFCLDKYKPDPSDNENYKKITLADTNNSGKENQIKKLFYCGYPYDSGTGEITNKILGIYREPNSDTGMTREEFADSLFRFATQKVLHEIITGEDTTYEYNEQYGWDLDTNQLYQAVQWIWEKINSTSNADAKGVVLQVFKPSSGYSGHQNLIVPIIAKNVKEATLSVAFENKLELVDIEIKKVSTVGGKTLTGATFKLNGEELTEVVENGEKTGVFKITGLRKGGSTVYTLIETNAPEGYIALDAGKPIQFTINDEGKIVLTNETIALLDDMVQVDESATGNGIVLIVKNDTVGYVMPETGGIGSTIFAVLGILIMIAACTLLTIRLRYANVGERRR